MNTKVMQAIAVVMMAFTFSHANAQGTTFFIKDGIDNPNLKAKMEHNVNAMIAAFKTAVIEKKSSPTTWKIESKKCGKQAP